MSDHETRAARRKREREQHQDRVHSPVIQDAREPATNETGVTEAAAEAEKIRLEDEAAREKAEDEALDAAHAKVKADRKAAKEAAAAAEAEDLPKRDHTKFIVLEDAGVIPVPPPLDFAAGKQRTLTIGGQNYEHVSEDRHGRWVYRAM